MLGEQSPVVRQAILGVTSPAPRFEADIPPEVFGLTAYATPTSPAPRIDRRTAIQVPAVKRSRDLIAGTLGGLPVDLIGPDAEANYAELLHQPEKNVPRSVTMTRLFEDMLFEGIAWWQITEFGWHNYPTKVKRLAPRRVTVNDDLGKVYVDGKEITNLDTLIRFDSPTDGLLIAGARAIRTCLRLEAAADRNADGLPPVDFFTPTEGVDPFEDDQEIIDTLDDWQEARRARNTAYVPAALKYNTAGWNPEQLQMSEQRKSAVVNIACTAGIDPEEFGVSTTSRTYTNQFDRRKAFADFTLAMYRQAFEDRMGMGDVTPRGYGVKINLNGWLRSDPKTRMETYKIGLEVGAYDGPDEVRALEDGAPLKHQPETPKEAPVKAAAENPADTFADDEPEVRLDIEAPAETFQVDVEKRTIRGLVVPYGVVGLSNGMRWQFEAGTLQYADVSRIKLWVGHDKTKAIGVAFELDSQPEAGPHGPAGLYGAFQVARGKKGDKYLRLAEDKVLDGLSVGLKAGGKFETRHGVNHAVVAPMMEVSLTPAPSFDDARVHAVAASADQEGKTMEPCNKCGKQHAAATECLAADVAAFEAEQGAAVFDAQSIADAIKAGFDGLSIVPPREKVDPAGERFEINEEPLYRFDGHKAQHSFLEDLRDANQGDSEARQRIDQYMGEAFEAQFAVTTGNAAALNPTTNRPDLYVPNLSYTRPLWDLITTGSIDDKTPFTIPKFTSATGLVGAHTEGVEPSPGTFVAGAQTVTPTAVSGKIEVNREVMDSGGSPQADQIIWNEMLNGWYEALEVRVQVLLASIATTEVVLASAVDAALVNAMQGILVGLQFARGGNRFTALALDSMLFPALVNAADTTGRKLLPVYGPTNAQGQVSGGFDRVQIGGLQGRAAWALGAVTPDNAEKSYLFVPSSVYGWASSPKRFTFEYQVKSVDIAIWGYGAAAVTRDSDVRPIDYTTADV